MQIVAECYTSTTVNIETALGIFSRMCSLQSLEMLESEHHLVTALSVESWPGELQTTQKHIRGWKIDLEAEMGFSVSEAYGLPVNAKSLVGSLMANGVTIHCTWRWWRYPAKGYWQTRPSRYPSAYDWLKCRIIHISC